MDGFHVVVLRLAGNDRECGLTRLFIVGPRAENGDIAFLRQLSDVFGPNLPGGRETFVDLPDVRFPGSPEKAEGPNFQTAFPAARAAMVCRASLASAMPATIEPTKTQASE